MMNKKIEFSKILTLLAIIIMLGISIWSIINYYALIKLAIISDASAMPDSAIPIACITTILGSLIAYCLYQFGLKNSRNKYGVDAEGNPFKEKIIFNSDEDEEDNGDLLTFTSSSWPEQIPVDCDYKGE